MKSFYEIFHNKIHSLKYKKKFFIGFLMEYEVIETNSNYLGIGHRIKSFDMNALNLIGPKNETVFSNYSEKIKSDNLTEYSGFDIKIKIKSTYEEI